jgi:Mrp family chromosome partitioning ATPase
MSALDQAIIKAYAKDRPAAASGSAVSPAREAATPALPSRASSVDQLYRDGALYRFERQPVASRAAPRVPAPHLPLLPPTSPRRNVRRSMLRLLAANQASVQLETPPETPPKIARKVIIRHISHAAAPPPLGILRPVTEGALERPAAIRDDDNLQAELPPEKFAEEQEIPAIPSPAPQVAPLNVAVDQAISLDVRAEWLHESSLAPMLLLADGMSATQHPAYAQVMVQVDALGAAIVETQSLETIRLADVADPTVAAPFPTKSLEDADEPRSKVYFDTPHVQGRHRPHMRFPAPAVVPEPTAAAAEPPAGSETSSVPIALEQLAAPVDEVIEPVTAALADITAVAQLQEFELQPLADELPFAEAFEAALASDLIPLADEPVPEPSTEEAPVDPRAARPAIPVWEVDRFHWPKTCEKLLADESGYLATAGDKLLAAVQDGLRVLGVTGSRRGEGRSTLALCLARAAAKAGIQVAVMDADFARPQLASKLGLETAFGWQDAALGKIPLSEAAIKSLADNITVLPLESSAATRRLSLADPRATATIRAAAATFELVILDLGPVAAGEELAFPRGEGCPLDAAIVVRDLRFATASEGEVVGHMLHDLGVEAVGIAENFVIEEELPATSV